MTSGVSGRCIFAVEDFRELFTTVMVAYKFVLLGVVRRATALRVIVDSILTRSARYRHDAPPYFSGTPVAHLALARLSRRWKLFHCCC